MVCMLCFRGRFLVVLDHKRNNRDDWMRVFVLFVYDPLTIDFEPPSYRGVYAKKHLAENDGEKISKEFDYKYRIEEVDVIGET